MGIDFCIHFEDLPLSPSENKIYRNVFKVGRVKSRDFKDYESQFECWTLKNRERLKQAQSQLTPHLHLSLQLDFYFISQSLYTQKGTIKRMDVTNRLKILIDLLSKALQIDDSQFFRVECSKRMAERQYVNATLKLFKFHPS